MIVTREISSQEWTKRKSIELFLHSYLINFLITSQEARNSLTKSRYISSFIVLILSNRKLYKIISVFREYVEYLVIIDNNLSLWNIMGVDSALYSVTM